MSVLVKGMDMPKSCAACRFRTSDSESVDPFTDYCYITNARLGYYDNKRAKWKKERRNDCPLDEVEDIGLNAFRNGVYQYIAANKDEDANFLSGLETAVVIAEKMAGVYEEVEE